MPPEGFKSLSVKESTFEKILEIMVTEELDSAASAVELAVNVTLAVETELR